MKKSLKKYKKKEWRKKNLRECLCETLEMQVNLQCLIQIKMEN